VDIAMLKGKACFVKYITDRRVTERAKINRMAIRIGETG
jgi:hypothetical protein